MDVTGMRGIDNGQLTLWFYTETDILGGDKLFSLQQRKQLLDINRMRALQCKLRFGYNILNDNYFLIS